jgi:hypothetical protein
MPVGKVLGIVAIVFAIIGALMPVVGLYVGWIALIIAAVAALCGEKGLVIGTVVTSALVFLLLTPSLWIAEGLRAIAVEQGLPPDMTARIGLPVSATLLAAPILCLFLHSTGRLTLGGASKGSVR